MAADPGRAIGAIVPGQEVFKPGVLGAYQHRGEAHFHRYPAEFDFRYNRRSAVGVEDNLRHDMLLAMTGGKRLTYRRIGEARLA